MQNRLPPIGGLLLGCREGVGKISHSMVEIIPLYTLDRSSYFDRLKDALKSLSTSPPLRTLLAAWGDVSTGHGVLG